MIMNAAQTKAEGYRTLEDTSLGGQKFYRVNMFVISVHHMRHTHAAAIPISDDLP